MDIISLLKQQGLHPPETLTIAITGECNLVCAHCWVSAGPSGAKKQVPQQDLERLINDFSQLGGAGLRVTGGEPLLHPGCLDLLARANDLPFARIILQTNAMLLGATDLDALSGIEPGRLQIQVSLDGASEHTHDLVRGPGAFQQTLAGLNKLVARGFAPQLAIFFTEMRHNLNELPDVLALAADLNISSVSSGSLVLCGRAASDDLVRPPEPEQYLELLERWKNDEEFRKRYEEIGCIAALEWCYGNGAEAKGCSFIKTPYLTATGVLYPCLLCHADDYAVSGVFEKGFESALREGISRWSSLQKISQSRVSALPECQQCPSLSSCGGGCMGRAWGSFGEFLVVEDRCRQRQATIRWQEKD